MMMNVIITGGHFENKGAQAMLLAVVQEIYNRNKDISICAFTDKPVAENCLKFNHVYWDNKMKVRLLMGKFKIFIPFGKKIDDERYIQKVMERADLVLDISGYSLTSQFGFLVSLLYLIKIAIFKKNNCKVVLLPQSFGPFKYKYFFHDFILFFLMKYYLKYPEQIFVREQQGYNDLKKFTVNNLVKTIDIVLQTQKPNREIIMRECNSTKINILKDKRCAAIIPNTRIAQWNQLNNTGSIYCTMIDYLINKGFYVYILRHSYEDTDICEEIYARYKHIFTVALLGEDYDCITLSEIISEMKLVVVSRYHALVHAYKSDIPAFVIGWAQKYNELMRMFDQSQYYFDIRKKVNNEVLLRCFNDLIITSDIESEKILFYKNKLTSNNVLSKFFDDYIA